MTSLASTAATPKTKADVIARLKKSSKTESKALRDKILAGDKLADADRDQVFNRACNLLVWTAPEIDHEILIEILRPSLAQWASSPEATKTLGEEIEKARDKLKRAKEDWVLQQAARAALLAPLAAVLGIAVGSAAPATGEVVAVAVAVAGETSAAAAPVPVPVPIDASQVLKHTVIQHKTAFYVFDCADQKYTVAHTRDEIAVVMRDALKGSPVEFFYENAKGKLMKKKTPDLLEQYSTVADELIYDMTRQQSGYHVGTKTFREAVCPLVLWEPRYDPQIEIWLNLLGGDSTPELLDWIATATRLDRQTCALYLAGKKGVGKGLLAAGLARHWRAGPPTALKCVVGNFNADLARCPLVLMDEALPKGFDSTELRSLIGQSSWTLSRKFLPNSPMVGCIRMIIAANNDDVLKQMGEECVTQDDIEAIVERFLHIRVSTEAAVYLASIGGYAATRAWVDDGLLARHALWLRDNRTVVPGKRFLVEGQPTVMHQRLVSQGVVQNLMLEWISRFLLDPKQLGKYCRLTSSPVRVFVGDGRILINTQGVIDGWGAYMRSDQRQPTLARVGRILRSFSTDEVRVPERTGYRYHVINPLNVISWANENQVGAADEITNTLKAPMKMPVEVAPVVEGTVA